MIKGSLVTVLCFILPALTVNAGDFQNGKELHQSNCTTCHISIKGGDGSGIYTREDRRIESISALSKQVNRCKDSLGMPWPPEQVSDVVEYLNTKYYKFSE